MTDYSGFGDEGEARHDAYMKRSHPLVFVRCDRSGHQRGREIGAVYQTPAGPIVETREPFNTRENTAALKRDGKRARPVLLVRPWFLNERAKFTFVCDKHGVVEVDAAKLSNAVAKAAARPVDVRVPDSTKATC